MRFLTGFFGFCVACTAIFAVSSSSSLQGAYKARDINTTATVGTFEVTIRDWMSDIIKIILGVEVGELLSQIDRSLKSLNVFITEAVHAVDGIKVSLDPATRQILEQVIEDALNDAKEATNPIISDLALVLPAISNKVFRKQSLQPVMQDSDASQLHFSDAADLIEAILGISLENLLSKIAEALEMADNILVKAMTDLSGLASTISDPVVANNLTEALNHFIPLGRQVIRPVLDSLYRVLPSRGSPKSQGMLADIMSGVLLFDVNEAANAFSQAWFIDMKQILDDSIDQLSRIPFCPDHVKIAINGIIGSTVQSVKKTIYPVVHVLVHFASQGGRGSYQLDNYLPRDLINSLLGVSLADFISYVEFSLEQTVSTVNASHLAIVNLAQNQTGAVIASQIELWAANAHAKLKSAIEPFMSIIAPILPPGFSGKDSGITWVTTPEEFLQSSRESTICDFSLKTGQNKDLIIGLISDLFGLEVTRGTTTLLTSMKEVEQILTQEIDKLNEVIAAEDVMQEVATIVHETINKTQDAIQPGLDVFLLFSSNAVGRHDKDVLADVVRTFSSISYRNFVLYLQFTAERLDELMNEGTRRIHETVVRSSISSSEIIAQVDEVLDETTNLATQAVQPFVKLIKPLISN